MDWLEPGKFYLFACPWDWTFVARFVRYLPWPIDLCEIEDSIYFTRTGATFDVLCRDGLVTRGDSKSVTHGGPKFCSKPLNVWPWEAATPWTKKT